MTNMLQKQYAFKTLTFNQPKIVIPKKIEIKNSLTHVLLHIVDCYKKIYTLLCYIVEINKNY